MYLRFNICVALLLLAACAQPAAQAPRAPQVASAPPTAPVTVAARTLAAPDQPCSDTFVPHALNHVTNVDGRVIETYDSNGAGVAINDIDADGDLDIVLANFAGPNTIFWNQGDLRFRRHSLAHGDSRGVTIVDVDGDGLQDIVFTRRFEKPTLWRNTGDADPLRRFEQGTLPDVNNPFYTLTWGDLDADGDLDMVAGSYDTALLKREGQIFTQRGNGVGVFVYEREGETYVSHRLATQADTLALLLPDLDGDRRPDILAGNDFNRPDGIWTQADGAWGPAAPFAATTENTMSFDQGDIDNNGSPEILATDMKPFQPDEATMAKWLPIMEMMTPPESEDDPQHAENVLQMRDAEGRWRNVAAERGLQASGWSWSSKFGDLDNDGFLDVYIVNGMIAAGMFDHLPDQELVEQNMAFRNNGRGFFTHAPEWGLGIAASGRGMSMADLDGDGDLDIVLNNLRSPALILENRLCGGGALEVDLRQPGSKNPFAIGAQLTLYTSAGTYTRDVRAASGYLSGDPARVHFGVPRDAALGRLVVRWPDGAVSVIEAPEPQSLLTVTR